MDLRIVIVSWNVRERLRVCLRSIVEHAGGLALEVIVVDNASADGTADMVRAEFPWVRLIANSENRGFAVACNQAISCKPQAASQQLQANSCKLQAPSPFHGEGGEEEARNLCTDTPDFTLLLNPDMRVLAGTLPGIVGFMREERNAHVGIAGCHLINEVGETVPHVRRFPRLGDQLSVMTKLPHLVPCLLNRYLVREFDDTREAHVDSIRGSFFCIRQALIEQIGVLDEAFFVWFEEVDFCKRAADAGWSVAYTPSVQCVDFVGQSFAQIPNVARQRMFTRSMCTYFRKYHAPWQARVLAGVRPFAIGVAFLRSVWKR